MLTQRVTALLIATANYADTVIVDDNVEFGIKLVAESSAAEPTYVKAEKFQNEDNSVFSAAIRNLNTNNYNRKYTAVAYALVPMADGTVAEFTTDSVTRSIYQVAVGIMKNSSADAENAPYNVDGAVANVLNAYINQVGIRLTLSNGEIVARTSGSGAYTGDVFFDVESLDNGDGTYAVTITPKGGAEFNNTVSIASWWNEYVRINNNHSIVAQNINDITLENNVLTFTFTVPN